MSEPNELERLRADLEVIDRYNTYSIIENARCDIIAKLEKLEAEADTLAQVKKWVKEHAGKSGWPSPIANYIRHLESDNAKQAARIAELGRTAQEWGRAANHQSESSLIVPDDLRTRIDVYEERIAELEARPVPPLDPKRVIATACEIIAEMDPPTAAFFMQYHRAGNAGIYPLAGDDT